MNKMKTEKKNSRSSFHADYKNFRIFVLRNVMERPVRTVAVVVGGLFLVVFIFLGILRLVDFWLRNLHYSFLNFVRFEGGVESWFAFYGSFFGVIATVVLGIIAVRVDVKIQRSELATQINGLSLCGMRLYDFKRDFKPSILVKDGDYRRFMIMLNFDKFDPYYKIEIKRVVWEDNIEINSKSSCIKNDNGIVMYLNFDDVATEDIEKTFNYFYRIRCFNSRMMKLEKRQRQLKLELLLQQYSPSNSEMIPVNLEITLENGGYKEDGYMMLEEKNYLLKIGSFY